MNEQDLRGLIEDVRRGRLSRRAFTRDHGRTRPHRAHGDADAGVLRRGRGGGEAGLQADQARRRRGAQGAVVAGPDAAQPALRGRHQGPGRLAHLLRAAGRMGRRWRPRAGARRRDSDPRERRPGRGRQVGHLEAQAGREVARRPAVHRRRLRLQLGIRRRPGDRRGDHRQLQGRQGRQGRRLTRSASSSRSRRRSGPTPSSAPAA